MKYLFLFFCLFLSSHTYTQDFLWAQQAGGTEYDLGTAIAVDASGNNYITGFFNGTATIGDATFNSSGSRDIYIAKYDTDGNFIWAQQAGGTSDDIGFGIALDGLGNTYITGYFQGLATIGDSIFTSAGRVDIFIAKYDTDGNFIWAQQDGGTGNDQGLGIALDASGNSYITGTFEGAAVIGNATFNSSGSADIFIAKYDTDGNFIWAQQVGGNGLDIGTSIALDAAGNNYITGYFQATATIGGSTFNSAGLNDVYIAKYDIDGNFIWAQQAGGTGSDVATGIAVDALGNNYITGSFQGSATIGGTTFSSAGSSDMFIAKYDTDGNFIWAQQDGGTSFIEGSSIAIGALGDNYITGYFQGTTTIGDATFNSAGSQEIFIANYDADGNFIWAQQAGGAGGDLGTGIAQDGLGNTFITGYFEGTTTIGDTSLNSAGSFDMLVAKFAPFPPEPIPTLSQWSILFLSLIMLIFGVTVVRQRKVVFCIEKRSTQAL